MNQTIGVNITPQSFQPTLHYSQGDVGRVFVVNVTDYDIPTGATVTCVATKPSGMGFTVSGTVSGNSVTFTSTAEMTDEWGRFPAEIRIASGSTLLGTANFLMIGEKDPHPASTIDGTQEELIPQLTLLVNRVEAAAESVHDLTVSATTLTAGSDATATYDSTNNSITFGIPRGADGDVTRSEFNDLKSDFNKSTEAYAPTFTNSKYINTNVSIGATVDLTPTPNVYHSCSVFTCSEGDTVLINGTTSASTIRVWAFLDTDNNLISKADASITATDLIITAPANTAKCVLNLTTASMGICLYGKLLPPRMSKVEIDISNLQSFEDSLLSSNTNNLIALGVLEERTYYIGSSGAKSTNNAFFSFKDIPVTKYRKAFMYAYSSYVPTTSTRNAPRSICFYDSIGTFISGTEPHAGTGATDFFRGYQVPQNAETMNVTFYYQDGETYKKPATYWANTEAELITFDSVNDKVYATDIVNKDDIASRTDFICARRPIITFTLDGNYPRTQAIIDIANNHGVKIGIAPKWNSSFYYQEGNEQSYYSPSKFLEWQADGHEILSHLGYNMPETTSYTDEQCIGFIKGSYHMLKARGFNLKGAIGSSGQVAERLIPYIQRWYSYACTVNNHSEQLGLRGDLLFATSEPYHLWRYSMQSSTLDGMKQAVNDAITNNGLVIFYGHAQSASGISPKIFEDYDTYGDDPNTAGSTTNLSGTDHFTEDNFDALLTYIDSKVADGACVVKTPFNAVNDYYRLRKTDFTW